MLLFITILVVAACQVLLSQYSLLIGVNAFHHWPILVGLAVWSFGIHTIFNVIAQLLARMAPEATPYK